jgi:hypothetical protein
MEVGHEAATEVGHEAATEVGHEAANEVGSEVATEDGSETATEDGSEAANEDGHEAANEDGHEAANNAHAVDTGPIIDDQSEQLTLMTTSNCPNDVNLRRRGDPRSGWILPQSQEWMKSTTMTKSQEWILSSSQEWMVMWQHMT